VNKMKKIIFGIVFSVFALTLVLVPALAAGKSAPKATGSYDYNLYSLDRHADFNAITTSDSCSVKWDVSGNWLLNFNGGTGNREFRNLVQDAEGNVTGEFYYYSGSWLYGGTLEGTVSGNTLSLHYVRPPQFNYTGDFVGTIGNGVLTGGTFSDSHGNNLLWTATGTSVKVYDGCTGKGTFNYSDANGTYYTVDVKYVSVMDNMAWFAGPVVSGNFGNYGQWLFVKVVDNGEPGVEDTSTGDFPLTEEVAKFRVATHAEPVIDDITIIGGNIQVHN
jgi:hypothetical protein